MNEDKKTSSPNLIVSMNHINKSFYGVPVLDDVSFDLKPGEVHALAGGNGAGKSTLMKILRGVYTKDSGEISIGGKQYPALTIDSSQQAGIAMVFQEFSLVPTMTVAENIFMGSEILGKGRFLDKKTMIDRAEKLLKHLGVDIDPRAEIGSLSTSYWQLTEIAKAMKSEAKVLILDEPTAALSADEIERFFKILRNLKEQGIGLIYISHRMDEIRRIADRITILRNGKNYRTSPLSQITDEEIVKGIAGNQTITLAKHAPIKAKSTEVLLEMEDVSTKRLSHINLQVNAGEVVGLAGLMGAGRTEVTQALFGIDHVDQGVIKLHGKTYKPKNPQKAIDASIALVPEDRRKQGLVVTHSVQDNLIMNRLKESQSFGLLIKKKMQTMVADLVKRFNIKVENPKISASKLSGGNQQKVVIAKWLGKEPDLLIMDEPTAGVDIGTKTDVLKEVTKYADQGKGVLFISSEFSEMVSVCDRYYIMKNGSITGSLDANDINDEADLMLAIAHDGKA